MSILIKGIEMPKRCNGCAFNLIGHCMAYKGLYVERKNLEYNSKPEWCPLVPVPPHGDLIDRNAITMTDFEIATCVLDRVNPYKNGFEYLLKKFEDAPTIIEAEGEE